MYNIRSHFNELVFAWSAYEKQTARRVKPSRNDYNLVRKRSYSGHRLVRKTLLNLVAVTTT